MEFTLTYRGPLRSNGKPKHKHEIRMRLHEQLQKLWSQTPLSERPKLLEDPRKAAGKSPPETTLVEQVGQHYFAPLVSDRLNLVCDLDITMLRPQEPGRIISGGGDIDNRLKTLFDALQIPQESGIPKKDVAPTAPGKPMYCLLKDDNLITGVAVRCDRLLDTDKDDQVLLLIRVRVKHTRLSFDNMGLGS
jgi:hypothetical protein